jgi:spoIIIJ-associated protein
MQDIDAKIQTLTHDLMQKLGFAAEVEVTPEESVHRIHIRTEDDASILIGKHARMLASLQRVLGAMLYKQFDEKVDILVDVNDYRDGQKERLIGIADNVARRVIEEGRPSHLSSFSAYERRIIHEHISQNYHSLESYSEGEDKFRKLVIAKKSETPSLEE